MTSQEDNLYGTWRPLCDHKTNANHSGVCDMDCVSLTIDNKHACWCDNSSCVHTKTPIRSCTTLFSQLQLHEEGNNGNFDQIDAVKTSAVASGQGENNLPADNHVSSDSDDDDDSSRSSICSSVSSSDGTDSTSSASSSSSYSTSSSSGSDTDHDDATKRKRIKTTTD